MLPGKIKVVCISDTHTHTEGLVLPPGDVLIHAGDFSKTGLLEEVKMFNDFLAKQPFAYKIVIAGNHDLTFDSANYPSVLKRKLLKNKPNFPGGCHSEDLCKETKKLLSEAIYLEDSGVEILGKRFYGSPWSPEKSMTCFKLPRGPAMLEKWRQIPADIDVLITHTPPFGVLDRTKLGVNAGCQDLLGELKRIKPKVHVFGHIHDGFGTLERDGVKFINAAVWRSKTRTFSEPICFEL